MQRAIPIKSMWGNEQEDNLKSMGRGRVSCISNMGGSSSPLICICQSESWEGAPPRPLRIKTWVCLTIQGILTTAIFSNILTLQMVETWIFGGGHSDSENL